MSIISMTGIGKTADKPYVLGVADGTEPRFVETTGLYEGIPKGEQVWATGSKVQVGINRGNLIPLSVDGYLTVTKVTRSVPSTEPPFVGDSHPWSPDEPSDEPVPEPEDVDPPNPEAPADAPYNPATDTVAGVIAYIEEHPDEAAAVLAAERAGKNRSGIIKEFTE